MQKEILNRIKINKKPENDSGYYNDIIKIDYIIVNNNKTEELITIFIEDTTPYTDKGGIIIILLDGGLYTEIQLKKDYPKIWDELDNEFNL
jgi:hypothetical protein